MSQPSATSSQADRIDSLITGRKPDMVNNPPHYTAGGIECIDAIKAALTPEEWKGFLKGQIIKYTWRSGLKGAEQQDFGKAQFYLKRLIK